MEILQIKNVTKRFGKTTASDNLSFDVVPGRVFGLLGPNGAGKTTLIRMITNILMPDEGSITLFGEKVGAEHQNRIGYLPEERGLYKKIKVLDQLTYFGQLKGLTKTDSQARAKDWLRKLDASDWETKKINELSKGMQQKVQFISTILHDPELLILDEPFSGFDPINTEVLKKIILDMKKQGKTIILSTHIMEQAEQLCDDICLINKGKIILSGELHQIKKRSGRDTILLEFEGSDDFLNEIHNVRFLNRTMNRAEFRIIDSQVNPTDILHKAIDSVELTHFEFIEPSLNEIFIDVVSAQGVGNE